MIIPIYFFPTVSSALAPLSAGTPTNICIDCGNSNPITVMNETQIPHPTWTNEYGKAVVLLDAVVLGGPNGVYI